MSSLPAPRAGDPVELREVTAETLGAVLKLAVAPDQQGFVASNAVSIAQAHFAPTAWFRAVYAGETPVGFVMLHVDPARPEYQLWRFMIDAAQQGKGFGRAAMARVVEHVRGLPGATELLLSHVPGPGNPGPFYERLGYAYTGQVEDGELVMRLAL